jgi:hypothetical protein
MTAMAEATRGTGPSIDTLAAVAVLDPEGRSVTLGDLWRGQATALLFLRHFG